jgi:hypothetical protein
LYLVCAAVRVEVEDVKLEEAAGGDNGNGGQVRGEATRVCRQRCGLAKVRGVFVCVLCGSCVCVCVCVCVGRVCVCVCVCVCRW